MEVYLTRHGETEWNQRAVLCGRSDIALSGEGEIQAEILADKLKEKGITIILTSPLMRARQTAEIIGKKLNIPIRTEALLEEQDFGRLEECPMQEEQCLEYRNNFFAPFPEGESVIMVTYRALKLIEKVKEKMDGQKILLVSHGAFCRVFHACVKGVSNEEYHKIQFENCEAVKYEL